MKSNVLKDKSLNFSVRAVKLYKYLVEEKKEYVISKQVLRSSTSVGAMIREAEHSESKADFIHKIAIARKEINETIYWLDLLLLSGYLQKTHFKSINDDALELQRLLWSSIKKAKQAPK